MKLTVVAIQATDIPKMGFLTKTDPYLVMKLSSAPEEFRTNYIENTLNPVWNQRFEFMVNDLSKDYLIVQMKDWDSVDQHKIISRLELPLRTIPTGKLNDLWYDMIPKIDKASGGRVRLLIQISVPRPQPAQQPYRYAYGPNQQQMQPPQVYAQNQYQQPLQQPFYGYGYYQQPQPQPQPQQHYWAQQTQQYQQMQAQQRFGVPPVCPLAPQNVVPESNPYYPSSPQPTQIVTPSPNPYTNQVQKNPAWFNYPGSPR